MSKNKCEWEWKKLGDVCEFNRGLTYSKKDEVEHSSNCILRSNNIDLDSNSLCLDELKYINDDFEIPTSKYVKSDCILICMSNGSKSHLGKVAYIDQHYGYAFGGFMGLLCPSSRISGKFLHKILSTPAYKEYIKSLSDGANINNLKYDDLKEFEIPVPPLAEQERIVKVLDDAFAKIDKIKTDAETNLQNAKDLFQRNLEHLFKNTSDSEKVLLKDIAIDFSRGKSKHRPRNDKKLFGGEYPFIQTGDIRNADKYVCEYSDTYNEFGLAQSKLWPSGTLCITIAANIAETGILTFDSCFPDSIIGLIPDPTKTTVDYIYYLLAFFKRELQILGKGAAQDNLNLGTFEKTMFPLPPLSIQKQIVAKLDSLSEKVKQLESNYKQVIADCDELKKSILKKAFEGQL